MFLLAFHRIKEMHKPRPSLEIEAFAPPEWGSGLSDLVRADVGDQLPWCLHWHLFIFLVDL